MVNWKEFKIIKRAFQNPSSDAMGYEINQEIEYKDGRKLNLFYTKFLDSDFFPNDVVEIDIDEVQKITNPYISNDRLEKSAFRKKADKKTITFDGKQMTIDEYNDLFKISSSLSDLTNRNSWEKHPEVGEIWEIWKEVFGKNGDATDEYKKSEKVNKNLLAEVKNDFEKYSIAKGGNYKQISSNMSDDRIDEILRESEKLLGMARKVLAGLKKLKSQKEATGNDYQKPYNPINNPTKDEAKELAAYKTSAYQEIENAMNQDPKISDSDLEPENRSWRLIEHAISKEEVDKDRVRVLADISAKRAAKQGKRKREDENEKNDTPTEQPDAKRAREIKNKVAKDVTDNEAALVVKEATRLEGDKDWKQDAGIESMEDKLMTDNPELYQQTVIEALKERMGDLNIKEEDLDEDSKKLLGGKITDPHQVKLVKNQAVKKIGELGARSKWTFLFDKAKSLIAKAKKNVTEQVKKEIKEIQSQIKSLKSSANDYLASYYQNEKNGIEKLEKDLSNYSTNQNDSTSKTPWGTIIPISLVAVAVIGVVAIIIVRQRKQNKLKK